MLGLKTPPQIAGDSIQETAPVAPTNHALPTGADGSVPRYVLISTLVEACYFRAVLSGDTTGSAVMQGWPVGPALVLRVEGSTHIRLSSGVGTAEVTVTPLENR